MPACYHIIPVWPLGANCTILHDAETKRAIVVDPGGDAPAILSYLTENKLLLDSIWLTHGHYDHLSALADFPPQNVPLYLGEEDFELFNNINIQANQFGLPPINMAWRPTPPPAKYELSSLKLEIMATPGHTMGGIAIILREEKLIIAGDTLFAGGVGRTDLPGGNSRMLRESLDKLFNLPADFTVITGHGELTTIGREKSFRGI